LFWHKDDHDWNTINRRILRWWKDDFGSVLGFLVYERDWGDWSQKITFSATYEVGGVKMTGGLIFTIQIHDDQLGKGVIDFKDPKSDIYNTGDAEFQMNY